VLVRAVLASHWVVCLLQVVVVVAGMGSIQAHSIAHLVGDDAHMHHAVETVAVDTHAMVRVLCASLVQHCFVGPWTGVMQLVVPGH